MASPFKIFKAHFRTVCEGMRVISIMLGIPIFVVSASIAAVLSVFCQLNGLVVFAATFLGLWGLVLALPLFRVTWESNFIHCLNDERLWSVANEHLEKRVGNRIKQIESGSDAVQLTPLELSLLDTSIVILMRRGQARKAVKVAEFLAQHNTESHPTLRWLRELLLAQTYGNAGKLERALTLLTGCLSELDRADADTTATALEASAGKTGLLLELHRTDEAETSLADYRRRIAAVGTKPDRNPIDRALRQVESRKTRDPIMADALELRLKILRGNFDLAESLQDLLARVVSDSNKLFRQLFFGRVQALRCRASLKQQKFADAEATAKILLEFYEHEVDMHGRDRQRTLGWLAYARLKQGAGDSAAALEGVVQALEAELEPGDPAIAEALFYLGQSYLSEGRSDEARQTLNKSLSIMRSCYPDKDPDTAEVESVLATISASA